MKKNLLVLLVLLLNVVPMLAMQEAQQAVVAVIYCLQTTPPLRFSFEDFLASQEANGITTTAENAAELNRRFVAWVDEQVRTATCTTSPSCPSCTTNNSHDQR